MSARGIAIRLKLKGEIKMLDEFEMKDKLRNDRKNIETIDDLTEYLKWIEENCDYDYGVAPRSVAQAALATAWYMSKQFGLTGFQAGFVMWDFIGDWNCLEDPCGLRLVNYDNMLYPQREDMFEKTISKTTWDKLQKKAKQNLEERKACDAVTTHWQSIVNGKVPFGYSVVDD